MKVVINKSYGGFGLSDKAYERLIELGIPTKEYKNKEEGRKVIFDKKLTPEEKRYEIDNDDIKRGERYWDTWFYEHRSDPLLIQVIEELKEKANNRFSDLKVVEIPDDVDYIIEDYDGVEWVAEKHRTWE